MSRIFVAAQPTGHVCTGASCPVCNPDNQIAAMAQPLAPSRGVLDNQHRAEDDAPLLPPRYVAK